MDIRNLLVDSWEYILRMLPEGWEQLTRETKAVERPPRGIPSLSILLRLLFMHLGLGYSLRETAARGRVADLAHVSDVALLKTVAGPLPTYEKESAKAWLYGKLLISLLTEKAIAKAKMIFPLGRSYPWTGNIGVGGVSSTSCCTKRNTGSCPGFLQMR